MPKIVPAFAKVLHTVTSAEATAGEAEITLSIRRKIKNISVLIWNDTDFWELHQVDLYDMAGNQIAIDSCISTERITAVVNHPAMVDLDYVRVRSRTPTSEAVISVGVTGEAIE